MSYNLQLQTEKIHCLTLICSNNLHYNSSVIIRILNIFFCARLNLYSLKSFDYMPQLPGRMPLYMCGA